MFNYMSIKFNNTNDLIEFENIINNINKLEKFKWQRIKIFLQNFYEFINDEKFNFNELSSFLFHNLPNDTFKTKKINDIINEITIIMLRNIN